MKKLFLLLALLGMVAIGCSKDEVDKGNDNKTEQPNEDEGGSEDNIPENIFFGLDKESVTFSPDGGSVDVIVYSNYKWEISGTSDWCTPSVKGGDANEDGQKVTFSADTAYDDREATFWFRCADKQIKFVALQKLKEVIIPDAKNTFNIPAKGGVAVISYQTSVDCEVIIPEDAQSWISIVSSRALVSESISLDIAKNTTYSARTAVVKVVAKDNAELAIEYTINQEQNDAILADENNTFTVPSAGGEVAINYQTNIDCEVIIPEEAQDWITIVPATRGLVAKSATLHIAENTTYCARTAVIKVVAKNNAELVVEYTINQEQNDAFIADDNNVFTVPGLGGEVVIKYQTNVDCEVIIPEEAQDWITIVPATRGLVAFNTTLNITANYSGELRSSVIKVVSQEDNELFAEYTITQNLMYYLCYTSSNGKVVEPYSSTAFGATILSNTYKDGVGIIEFNAPITTIEDDAFYRCSSLTSVTIPDSVTTIGNNAFYDCYSLTSVIIPDSVTTIGDNAFYFCTNLTSVTIPDSVTTIGEYAFAHCYSLTSVTIGNSVTTIGNYAFYDCYDLTSVIIPDSVTTIGNWAFWGCSSLTSVTIGDGVTTIGEGAFYDCDGLTSVTIPDNVTTIGQEAFSFCRDLKSVTIGNGVTAIGDYAFSDCESLTSVTIGDSVTTIGESVFYHCHSLTSITIPDSVTTIGMGAFFDCNSLTSVTIPDSVTTIGEAAFCYCSSLTSVTIGNGVTTIGSGAFSCCRKITSVTIPESVTMIGAHAFEGLYIVYCKPVIPPVIVGDVFGGVTAIYVPARSVEVYKSNDNPYWNNYYKDNIIGYNFE